MHSILVRKIIDFVYRDGPSVWTKLVHGVVILSDQERGVVVMVVKWNSLAE